jgi:hypothetical protein
MLQRLLFTILAVGGLLASGAAWASTTNLNLTSHGDPLRSTVVSLTVRVPGKPDQHLIGRTDSNGHLTMTYRKSTTYGGSFDVCAGGAGAATQMPATRLEDGGAIGLGAGDCQTRTIKQEERTAKKIPGGWDPDPGIYYSLIRQGDSLKNGSGGGPGAGAP